MSYQYIINPKTGRKNKITSKQGQKLLMNYLSILQGGSQHFQPFVPEPLPNDVPKSKQEQDEAELGASLSRLETAKSSAPPGEDASGFKADWLAYDMKILEIDRRRQKALVDSLTASYKAKYGSPDVRNPDSIGDDYDRQRLAVNNLMIIENEIKDFIYSHTTATHIYDEDIFKCLDDHHFNIKEALQCLEDI